LVVGCAAQLATRALQVMPTFVIRFSGRVWGLHLLSKPTWDGKGSDTPISVGETTTKKNNFVLYM